MHTLPSSGLDQWIISEHQGDVLLVMPRKSQSSILECLGDLGVAASIAATCREARIALKQDRPTPVVVTGVTLDDGNWSDLLRFVVDNGVRTSVVVVAPDADACLWSEAMWRGAHDLLVEPYELGEVRRILDSAFRSVRDPEIPKTEERLSRGAS